jgi:hypothetical protein
MHKDTWLLTRAGWLETQKLLQMRSWKLPLDRGAEKAMNVVSQLILMWSCDKPELPTRQSIHHSYKTVLFSYRTLRLGGYH